MNEPCEPGVAGVYPWLDGHWSFFIRRLEAGRLAHALLIEGPSGNGKTALASAMVAKLLCREDQAWACGRCRSCNLRQGEAHPDYFNLHPEEESKVIKVDQVRSLIGKLDLTTSISQRKVAYIHPAEAMNGAAANALLKSLEEPAGDTVLILVSDSPASLPITIRSRCQTISVSQPDGEVVLDWLKNSSDRSAEEIGAALLAAGGSPLRAMNYLDLPELDGYTKARDALATLLGRPGSASVISAQLSDLNEVELWRWLSMCTGDLIKSLMTGSSVNWLPANCQLQDKTLLQLQKQADINRRLSATQVRGDLLLQDWLIRWAEQGI
jgi:DNA polymerase-3 subunit delta'